MRSRFEFLFMVFMVIVGTASSARELQDKDLLGRWYSEKTMEEKDQDDRPITVRICASTEYFKNHMSNFQGEVQVNSNFDEDDESFEIAMSIFLRGSAEWQIIEQSLLEKIVDIKLNVKNFSAKIDGAEIKDEKILGSLQDRYGELEQELKQFFYVGMTSDDQIISYERDFFVTEELLDDGSKSSTEHQRTKKLLEGCK